MALRKRRRKLLQGVFVLLFVCAFMVAAFGGRMIRQIGGNFSPSPRAARAQLSPGAVELMHNAFEGLTPDALLDYHLHLGGIEAPNGGIVANPRMLTWWRPLNHLKFLVFLSAAQVTDPRAASEQYLGRLTNLIESMDQHGRFCILALDYFHNPDGIADPAKTTLFVSNDHVLKIATEHPKLFMPVISVHPYRSDAIAELERGAGKGARMVKWVPNSMGIDPADPRCDPFYKRMKQLNLALLSHTGAEHTLEAGGNQHLGNPLRLRRPLDQGVKVIMAHCATTGSSEDLDHPDKPKEDNFSLFLRLMDEPKYRGLLFGDLSATTQVNHAGKPLKTLLQRTDLHPRLVNGSDYPLPAINLVIMTRMLAFSGFITREERLRLNELYKFNPLLFDFVLKRTLHDPETGAKFSPGIFMRNSVLHPVEN
jgi:uncharacterized protein